MHEDLANRKPECVARGFHWVSDVHDGSEAWSKALENAFCTALTREDTSDNFEGGVDDYHSVPGRRIRHFIEQIA